MTDQPYNRTVIYPLEKPLADDLNQQFSQADRTVRDTMFSLLRGQQGFLFGSLEILESAPAALSVLLKAGIGYQDAPADVPTGITSVVGLNDLSRYKPIVLQNDLTVAVPAPPGAQSRIDLIEVRYERQVDNPQSRNFLDPNTNSFNPATVSKTLDFNVDGTLAYYTAAAVPTTALAYKSGVVAGSPVAPVTDTGYLALAHILVVNGVTTILTADITDLRGIIELASGGYLGRQIITAAGTYTPTLGTKRVVVRMCGAGGGGSGVGASPTGGQGACGAGGASGVYFEQQIAGTPLITGGAVTIGAAGAAGVASTAGGAGGDTTVTVQAVVYTAKGGGGGNDGGEDLAPPSARAGGITIAGSSPGDFTTYEAGVGGILAGNAGDEVTIGGGGGSGRLGVGGVRSTQGAGAAASGYGAGGGGASNWQDASTYNGGAGAPGVIIIDEWT